MKKLTYLFIVYCYCTLAYGSELKDIDAKLNIIHQNTLQLTGVTGGQFSSVISLSSMPKGEVSATTNAGSVTTLNNPAVPGNFGGTLSGGYTLKNTKIGSTFFNRSSDYRFGEEIVPPDVDENNDPLPFIVSNSYWRKKPHNEYKTREDYFHNTNNIDHIYGKFYWSEGAQKLYATSPGPIELIWVKNNPDPVNDEVTKIVNMFTANSLSGPINAGTYIADNHKDKIVHYLTYLKIKETSGEDIASVIKPVGWSTEVVPNHGGAVKLHTKGSNTEIWEENSGVFYACKHQSAIVSGSPIKTPRRLYWTGVNYDGTPANVPPTSIKDIKFLYREQFPKNVPIDQGETISEPGIAMDDGTNTEIVQTRTIWFNDSSKTINALNIEGRIFMELLGPNIIGTFTPSSLGFEIVDVIKAPDIESQRSILGEPFKVLTASNNDAAVDNRLHPKLATINIDNKYVYEHHGTKDNGRPTFYGIRETINDSELILWWMFKGRQGIKWPEKYVKYDLDWPTEANKYSHYLRPKVSSETDAALTSVKLEGKNSPVIMYQDDIGFPRAKLTSNFEFYTYINNNFPAHRTLIKFTSGDHVQFERVFSWLSENVKDNNFLQTEITDSLGVYNSITDSLSHRNFIVDNSKTKTINGETYNYGKINFPLDANVSTGAYATSSTVYVGETIKAPEFQQGHDGDNYLAGFVNKGTSYSEEAYKNPFSEGFSDANKGSIIPVNSIPGNNELEVIWFRSNSYYNGSNEDIKRRIDLKKAKGFEDIYWPSIIGNYTIKWPHEAKSYHDINKLNSIVLSSNQGSGPLDSLKKNGSIYYQNNPSEIGYNPNEEHAIIIGGQAYALRNDLNITTDSNGNKITNVKNLTDYTYSSEPYVLLAYKDINERPAMQVYRVLSETSEFKFNYNVIAGTILQPPMPLPFLEKLKDHDEFNGEEIAEYSVSSDAKSLTVSFVDNVKFKTHEIIKLDGFKEVGNNSWVFIKEIIEEKDKANRFNLLSINNPVISSIKSVKLHNNLLENKKFDIVKIRNQAYYKLKVEKGKKYYYHKHHQYEGIYNGPITYIWDRSSDETISYDLSFHAEMSRPGKNDIRVDSFEVGRPSSIPYISESTVFTAEADWVIIRRGAQGYSDVHNYLGEDIYAKIVEVHEVNDGNNIIDKVDYLVTTEKTHGYSGDVTLYNANNFSGLHSPLSFRDKGIVIRHFVHQEPILKDAGVFETSTAATFSKEGNTDSFNPSASYEEPTQSGNYTSATMMDRKDNIWVYRGPHNMKSDSGDQIHLKNQSTFKLSFYYKILDGFNIPSLKGSQLAVGTTVPYLLENKSEKLVSVKNYSPREAKGISYTPMWPSNAPLLKAGQTLSKAQYGLPEIRGNKSLKILYQQSVAESVNNEKNFSVTLHDPTREKVYNFGSNPKGLSEIPKEVFTQNKNGKLFFPELPPHLVNRFFFDPNRGKKGQLVLQGVFVDEVIGDDFYLLNVLSDKDKNYLYRLANLNMRNTLWNDAIDNLSTEIEVFKESPVKIGHYESNAALTRISKAQDIVEILSDETPVDSYALTANGFTPGYVTLISGNGRAIANEDDPIQMHVIEVGGDLNQGEAKLLVSDNPLSEKITIIHSNDLASEADKFEFDWRIARQREDVYERVPYNNGSNLINIDNWIHKQQPDNTGEPYTLGNIDVRPKLKVNKVELISTGGAHNLKFLFDSKHNFQIGDSINIVGFKGPNILNTMKPILIQNISDKSITISNYIEQEASDNSNTISGWESLESVKNTDGTLQIQTYGFIEESDLSTNKVHNSELNADFMIPSDKSPSDIILSLECDDRLGVVVRLNNSVVITKNMLQYSLDGISDTPTVTPLDDYESLSSAYAIDNTIIKNNNKNKIQIKLWSDARSGSALNFDLKLEAKNIIDLVTEPGSKWTSRAVGNDLRSIIIGDSADVDALSDSYIISRYRYNDLSNKKTSSWSKWTEPTHTEGWIKRVLAGINPFNQRVQDLFSNRVSTTSSMLTQAGQRWEGDVALDNSNIQDKGLIEIYETVLNRGRMLSIDSGINHSGANDALLLAAGYINDLYIMLGDEAWADASNPTIGIGTNDNTYGDIATSLFAFKGQVPTLLEEELALLRGRDDFTNTGVESAPVYNRLYWNYTRGINAGEVIYSINYNIKDNIQNHNGKIDAADAYKMYPQGHGDAYGHYLTAIKGYYKLINNSNFDWVPRAESVTILGKEVQVDYFDERKFAAAAASIARTGSQIVDLTWSKDFNSGEKINWDEEFYPTKKNEKRAQITERFWGVDHWASRTGQGALINWVVGNSMLPQTDMDPNHSGITKVDRTTVPELSELSATVDKLQATMDSAETGLNPLGFTKDTVTMDISPEEGLHYEQIYEKANEALNNATIAFDATKDLTQLMRSEEDSLFDLEVSIEEQELAYKYQLIELYGTPYSGDIGPGKTWNQGYDGPDLTHFMYIDQLALTNSITGVFQPEKVQTFKVDIQQNDINMYSYKEIDNKIISNVGFGAIKTLVFKGGIVQADAKRPGFGHQDNVLFDLVSKNLAWEKENYMKDRDYIEYSLSESGYPIKPNDWGRRSTVGEIQQQINAVRIARNNLASKLAAHEKIKYELDREIEIFESQVAHKDYDTVIQSIKSGLVLATDKIKKMRYSLGYNKELALCIADGGGKVSKDAIPDNTVLGTSSGGQVMSPLEAAASAAATTSKAGIIAAHNAAQEAAFWFEVAQSVMVLGLDNLISGAGREIWTKESVLPLDLKLKELNNSLYDIQEASIQYGGAQTQYRNLVAKGIRIQAERAMTRRNTAAVIQGFRTRDSALRVFRNEKLERFKTLRDMASKYAFLAAQAYDYETGLLGSDEGRKFINKIINSRALGVVVDGEPVFAGSESGDPGISSSLAELKNDWSVVKGRLGLNNPDLYYTTLSLRKEKYRILSGEAGSREWGDVLEQSRKSNILDDKDVRRYCMQVGFEDNRPVPGIIIDFSTTIKKGLNVFGNELAGGDNQFSTSSFATKIWSAGIAFEGYVGMDDENANNQGGISPANPTEIWLDPNALSKTPYVYLIPVGKDYMRSPPLGDESKIRSWTIQDLAVPLPFNIGNSEYSTKKLWQSSDSLTEDLFSIRKHQPFRALSSFDTVTPNTSIWKTDGYDGSATSRRLIGRSVWNSKWKIVIPGHTLLNDPEAGLDRFIQTVKDIKVHFNTYSYSGN